MTGSSTTGISRASGDSRTSATASMMPALASMPILIASAPMSSSTTRIWSATKPGGTGWVPNTPRVFCAVRAVIAVMA